MTVADSNQYILM